MLQAKNKINSPSPNLWLIKARRLRKKRISVCIACQPVTSVTVIIITDSLDNAIIEL